MKPDVSLCMIVRNEEQHLAECLRGVRPLMREVVVIDTGSTDRTKAIAAEWGAQVYDFPWCDDFAAARNESVRRASGRWVFWLDADDRIDPQNGERLAALFARLDQLPAPADVGFFMVCRSTIPTVSKLGSQVTHLRLFPREAPVRWVGRVHERLAPRDGQTMMNVQWSDIVIRHVGYADRLQKRRKLQRNLRLLQLNFLAHPDDPPTLFHLGWAQLSLGNHGEALRFLKRSLRVESEQDPLQVRKTYGLMVECLSQSQRKREALDLCGAGLQQFPQDTELLFRKGQLLGEFGDLPGAEQCFLELLTRPADTPLEYGVEIGLRGARTHYLLGLLYEQQGRVGEAELQHRAALAEEPQYSFAWVGLGQLYLALGRRQEFAAVIERLAACPNGNALAPTLLARQCIAERRFDEARVLLDRAIALDSESLWPRLVLGDLLFASGSDRDLCVRLHREALQALPQKTALRERLESLLAQAPVPPLPTACRQEASLTR